MRQCLDRNRESSCQPEITDLNISILCHQQILGFKIAMNNPLRMTVINTTKDLIQDLLHLLCQEIMLVSPHILLQIVVNILEDQSKFLVLGLENDLL